MRKFKFVAPLGLSLSLTVAVGAAQEPPVARSGEPATTEVVETQPPATQLPAPTAQPPAARPMPPQPPGAPPVQPAPTDMTAAGQANVFGQMPQETSSSQLAFNPNIMGDLAAGSNLQFLRRIGAIPGGGGASGSGDGSRIPIVSRGAFKIAENESPIPQCDRFYVTYDYFYNVNAGVDGPGVPRQNLHREVFGFEKCFLDGDMSIGVRLPLLQPEGGLLGPSALGDLSVITKFALIHDRNTGNALSAGLMVTAPTATGVITGDNGEKIHPTLIQPFLGYRWVPGNVLVQGFVSSTIPTDSSDQVLLFNDVCLGYFIHRQEDALIATVLPVFEVHVNTGLNNPNSNTVPTGFTDSVIFTNGVQLLAAGGSALQVGIAYPITGPKPFDLQALVQWNFRF